MQNQETSEEDIPMFEAESPTERDLFFLSWGLEIIKSQFNTTNELLKQQIAICTTLLTVSLIFEGVFEKESIWRLLVAFCFFIGLLLSFVGLMPFEREKVWLDSPTEIEDYTDASIKHKKRFYFWSAVAILSGIFIIVLKLSVLSFK